MSYTISHLRNNPQWNYSSHLLPCLEVILSPHYSTQLNNYSSHFFTNCIGEIAICDNVLHQEMIIMAYEETTIPLRVKILTNHFLTLFFMKMR